MGGTSQAILKQEPHVSSEGDDLDPCQMALQDLLTPACFICDINGAEVALGGMQDLAAIYRRMRSLRLEKDGCQVVRTKNGFSKDAEEGKGGYRDLKLWIMVNAQGTSALTELQVHLHALHVLKDSMHMPYECSRGSFDHPHLAATWEQKVLPRAGVFERLAALLRPLQEESQSRTDVGSPCLRVR